MLKKAMISKKFIYLLLFLISSLTYLFLTYRLNRVSIKTQRYISKTAKDPKQHISKPRPERSREKYGKQRINEMEKKYQKERERIQKVCKKYYIPRRKLIDKEFIHVLRNHKIALCSHAKVGSLTWRSHFTNLVPNNKDVKRFPAWELQDNFTIREYDFAGGNDQWISPLVIKNFIRRNKFLSVSFVRHPFERLVSAYNDKIYENGVYIKKTGYEKWFKNDRSFSSFVNLVLHEYQTNCNPSKPKTSKIGSNWDITNCESKINRHWRPFGFRCSYCDINYDVIGRMENWNDDFNYIIRKRKLEKYFPIQKADNFQYHASKQNTTQATMDHFSKLSKKQKDDLYKMFRTDFEMFNYNAEIYL